MSVSRPPLTATCRLQMNAGFTLAAARARLDYFARLGVSHLYLSPVFAARRGSMHGYDVIDPTRINPELGTERDLRALSDDLHARHMGLIVDIVPNHMGIGAENRYWDDVLTHGERSRYASWFDIRWARPGSLHRKLMLPVLGDELDQVVARGELRVELREGGTPRVVYFAESFPLDPATLPDELQLAQTDPEEAGELAATYSRPSGRARLRALLEQQHYQLMDWRRGPHEINYRRFFDVNDLAALCVEIPHVFDETHRYLVGLVRDGVIDGVRVDHIDGLLDPHAYLARLRAALPDAAPIFVEKILSPGESLRTDWPIQGTTGYEFLKELDDCFIDPDGFERLDAAYRRLRRMGESTFEDAARAGKRAVLDGPFHADVSNVAELLLPIARGAHHRWTRVDLHRGVVDFIIALPVYRTYVAPNEPLHPDDRAAIERALADSAARGASEVVPFIGRVLLDEEPAVNAAARLHFAQRLQQVSGPATAKGVEDTALYAYLPLASRNEVGGAPAASLVGAVARFHAANAERAAHWPLTLLATSTHDTKRSADVRARIEALAEMPEEWEAAVVRWREMNAPHRQTVDGRSAPDLNTEYLLYQTLIALWPAEEGSNLPDRRWRESMAERIGQYLLKASREAKMRTSWTSPDAPYEGGLKEFVANSLEGTGDASFLADLARVASRAAAIGGWNGVARVALHLTAPGTPDIYQGDELWNYTLVDPDNRRRVDYDRRASLLAEVESAADPLGGGTPDILDDRVRLLVVHRLLTLRRTEPALFTRGGYRPLAVRGARAEHVIAFLRTHEGRHVVTVVPRLVRTLVRSLEPGAPADGWRDTAIVLPPELADQPWRSRLVDQSVAAQGGLIDLEAILSKLPVAVLGN